MKIDKEPKVSIIIPVYNAEEYLSQCLDSILSQTLKEIEVLCTDDGSTDRSLDILQQYSAKDSRIKVFQQANLGAGYARNKGMQNARGTYIAFMDSDDFYPDNDVLRSLYEAAHTKGALICGGSVQFLRKGELVQGELQGIQYYFTKNSWVDYKDCQQDFYYQRFIFNRAMLLEHNLVFPPYRRYQDPPFFVRAMLTAERFYAIPKVVYTYREGVSYRTWNAEKVCDRLMGLADELVLTRNAKLEILHTRIVERLKGIYNHAFTILEKDEENERKFDKIRDAVNLRLVQKKPNNVDMDFLNSFLQEKRHSKETENNAAHPGPKVSFVLPVYNVENYLRACLFSVVNQTLKEIEIICVNDGSTDQSLEILEEFAKKDSRIRIITQPNAGLSSARNTGARAAQGKYIFFVDSDDYIELDAACYLYQEAEKDQLEILFFDGESFYDPPEVKKNFPGQDCCYRSKEHKGVCTGVEMYASMRKAGDYKPMAWLQFISRQYYEEKNLSFREGILHEDVPFTSTCLLQANRVGHRRKNLYHYRRRAGAITGSGIKFAHVYGRFVGILHMAFLMTENDYGSDVEQSTLPGLSWMTGDLVQKYNSLPKEEQEKRNGLRPVEKEIFNLLIGNCSKAEKQVSLAPINGNKMALETEPLRKRIVRLERQLNYANKEIQNIQASWTYRIGCVLTWFPRKVRGGIRCYQENGLGYTLDRVLVHLHLKKDPYKNYVEKENKVVSSETKVLKEEADTPLPKIETKPASPKILGCSPVPHSPELIVSLTSFPGRISTVHKTIETILCQTEQPDKVILWLANEQFPNKEKDLPQELLALKAHGLSINWCHDTRSYKKLIPTLHQYPDAIIITADDDVYYHENWIKALYTSYLKWPDHVHCHRDTKFYLEGGEFKWVPGGKDKYPCPSYLHKLVGIGGVLYPPHSLHPDVLREDLFIKLARTNDDLWFWFMAIRNRYKILVVENNVPQPKYVEGTQDGECLTKINDQGPNLFLQDLGNLFDYYPEVKETLIKEYDFMEQYIACAKIDPSKKDHEYYRNLSTDELEANMVEWYARAQKKWLNLDNPRTFNDKLQWLKLYDSSPLKTQLADKYLVRDYVRKKIGEDYLIPLLGVWDSFDDIDFDELPNQFVLKANHGCGWNVIVTDKTKFDVKEAKKKFDVWMNTNFAFRGGMELQYMNIKPRIIAEQYLENNNKDLFDYKVFCFGGKADCVMFLSERKKGLKMAFFDLEWNKLPFTYSFPRNEEEIPKPKNLDLLIEVSEKLAADFPHVRVDFYVLNDGSLKFGELTFTSANGGCIWNPPEQNLFFGDKIKLPPRKALPQKEN